MSSPRSLETNVIFLCGEVSLILHRALTAVFKKKKINVTVEQFAILAVLFYRNGINQQEISVQLNRNKTTITRVLSNMERNKLIVRVTNKSDTRGKLIFLTAKGKTIQQRAIACSGSLYQNAISGIKKNALDDTAILLNKIIHNLK